MKVRGFLSELATVELELGDFEPARDHAQESLTIANELIPDDWRKFNAENLLGAALSHLGEEEKAKELLLGSHESLYEVEAFLPQIVERSFNRILYLLGELGEDEEIQQWKEKQAEFRQRVGL